jgi:hypothetical protein
MITALRLFLPAVAVLAVGLFAVQAPAEDLLKEAKQRLEVERQRVEQEVQDIVKEADALSKNKPGKAAERLKAALAILDDDSTLREDRRESLKRKIRLQIKFLEGDERNLRSTVDVGSDLKRAREDERRREVEKIKDTLNQISDLRRAGRSTEANALAAELNRQYPGSKALEATRITGIRTDVLADARQIRDLQNTRNLQIDNDIRRSAIPEVNDMTFPKDWKEKSERRTKLKITEKERAIMKALNTPITVEFKDNTTFQEALDYLQKLTGQTVLVDNQTLKEVGVDYTTVVNVNLRKATFRTVLKKVLADLGLTYIVKDESIQIVTPQVARETLSSRVYYVGDVVGATDLRWGPIITQLQMQQNVLNLMNIIQSTIEPNSWQINNGPGSIVFEPVTMSFIVRQTAEIHFMLGLGLR